MQAIFKRLFVLTLGVMIGMLIIGENDVKAQSYIKELENQWVQPVDGTITDTFGTRHGKHKGIDIAAPDGEEIVSVSDGKVTKSYYSSSYGNVVFIVHPEGYETVYAHLSKRLVSEGDQVKKGQVLGIIGNTGISTGTHLHFELHKGEWTYEKEHALDPLFVFDSQSSTAHAEQHEENITNTKEEINDLKKDSTQTDILSISTEKPVSDLHKDIEKKVITVSKGDTLWELSSEYKVSITSLQEWNNLQSDVIYPEQKLTLYLNKEQNYVVQPGDTIQSIAQEYGTSPKYIKKMNDINSEFIYPQQVLIISEKGS